MTLKLGSFGPLLIESPAPFILTVGINRPEARNSINDAVAAAIGDTMEKFDADERYRVAVVHGIGKGFCAGLDLKSHLAGETGMHPDRGFAGITMKGPKKPIIAAIEGFALAGGLELALGCDLIVAAENAVIGLPEVQRGLVADGGALLHLPRRIPYHVAMEVALTGEPISVERLHDFGLINRVALPGLALEEALRLCEQIAHNAPLAVVATKKILHSSRDWPMPAAWDLQDRIARPVWSSQDAAEGARAFTERREPRFSGV